MIDAERPEALWLALRMVQAVLRESPSALACSSSVRNPADLAASASSLILEDCRAFILAVSGSGRSVRACPRAAADGRNTSDGCDSMHCFPLVGRKESCDRMFVRGCTSTPCFTDTHQSSRLVFSQHIGLSPNAMRSQLANEYVQAIYRSMYALADASGATAMTRIICWVGPRAKRLRAANKAPPKATSVILSLRAPNRWWRTRRKSALFPHCCRIATFFVSSLDAALPLPFLQHARRFLFPTIPTRRTLSVTNVTSLVFIFFISDIPLLVFFAGLRNWRSGGTETRCRCSPRKYYSGRTCTLADHAQLRTSRSSALISLST